jgi:hypothetical protein
MDPLKSCPVDVFSVEELKSASTRCLPHLATTDSEGLQLISIWNSIGIQWLNPNESDVILQSSSNVTVSLDNSRIAIDGQLDVALSTSRPNIILPSSSRKRLAKSLAATVTYVNPWEIEHLNLQIDEHFYKALDNEIATPPSHLSIEGDKSISNGSSVLTDPELAILSTPPLVNDIPMITSNLQVMESNTPLSIGRDPLPTLHRSSHGQLSDLRWGYLSSSSTTQALCVLQSFINNSDYSEFISPVPIKLYPLYSYMVPYSMCLEWIMYRLQRRYYRSWLALAHDVHGIFAAACQFNEPRHDIVKNAYSLRNEIFQQLAPFFIDDQFCSSFSTSSSSFSSSSNTTFSSTDSNSTSNSLKTSSDLIAFASLYAYNANALI